MHLYNCDSSVFFTSVQPFGPVTFANKNLFLIIFLLLTFFILFILNISLRSVLQYIDIFRV